ncbi:MAG: FAD-dependent monooxygenase [Flammeovirgaceae bacterium]|nr:FAD-dependent monooxygenase [Flammeovirgaceae bacterium]
MVKVLTTQVLIIGAGPTGLMAANQLSRFGIDFIIADTKSGPTKESRAIAVTARSLEIYQQMGIVQEAISGGKPITFFNLYSNGKLKGEVKIGEIGKGLSEFSYMLTFEQSKNEELLAYQLVRQGKVIYWNYEFIELKEHKEKIRAVLSHDHEFTEVNAAYLIACDGANSAVRQQLNFSFKGGTYSHKFFVADTVMKWNLAYNRLIIAPGDQNFCAFLPLYSDGGYRVIGTLPKKYFNKEDISFQDIKRIVINTLGLDVEFESVHWFSTYKLHHRGVDHFSDGRVFLAGDSSHIHSPAGGQGMNTGLQDAYNLCWKLALVLQGHAKPTLLNTYNEERLPFAKWLLQFTDRGFNIMTSDKWFVKIFRKYIALNFAKPVLKNPWIRPIIFKVISQIWYSYHSRSLSKSVSGQRLRFKAGDRLPFFSEGNIYPNFTKASFHLLHVDFTPLSVELRAKIIMSFPFPINLVEADLNHSWKKLGVTRELFILVRPDNYIGFISDSLDEIKTRKHLEKHFIYRI